MGGFVSWVECFGEGGNEEVGVRTDLVLDGLVASRWREVLRHCECLSSWEGGCRERGLGCTSAGAVGAWR